MKPSNIKKNLLILGQGRLASEIILLMIKKKYFKYFDLKCFVTNDLFFNDFIELKAHEKPAYINNKNRNEKLISEAIKIHDIDMILSIQHPWILSSDIIKSVNGYAFNLHNAKLPNYKGYNSISHAIINMDKFYYSTIHLMVDMVDEGSTICESKVTINFDDDAFSLYSKTVNNVKKLFSTFIDKGLYSSLNNQNKDQDSGIFYSKNSLENIRDLTNINDPELFDRLVRAVYFPPYEPAFVVKRRKKLYQIPLKRKQHYLKKISPINSHNFDLK